MNHDRRFSPDATNPDYPSRTINYRDSRSQQITPRGGIDARAQAYGREYPPLRSRSQTNMEQDYGDRFSHPAPFYDNRGLDTKSRSKSLDTREFRGGDYRNEFRDDFYRNEHAGDGGVVIPIRRDNARDTGRDFGRDIGRGPQYDYRSSPQSRPREVEPYGFDDRRPPVSGQEIHSPYNQEPVNRDFGPRRSFDGRAQGDSPKSYSSRFKDNRRAIEYDRRGGFGDDFEREDYGAIQPYRGPPMVSSGGGGGGYRSSRYHRSHHESHGGGHESSFGGGLAITQQPQVFHPDMRPVRPIQHRRIQCCCFKFVWPPWSYENAPPPQPIYRNI